MKRTSVFNLTAALLACALPLTMACSADQQKQRPDPLPATSATLYHQDSQQEQQQQPEVRTFTGRISKSGEKFVLEDASAKASYQLDDQKKAQQYQGKNVRVTGTLDADNNLIHVQAIEEAV
jgi:hypothetical protein